METKSNNNALISTLVMFIAISICLGGYLVYDKVLKQPEKNINSEIKQEENDKNSETIQEENKDIATDNIKSENEVNISINKRLYNIDSEMHKQRYYLLLDDATYGIDQNFLNKKTYILDLNMIDKNEIVKEVDLASVFSPIANAYINNHKGNNNGICSVEYFSANKNSTPPPIDYEKEVAFTGYYRCVNNNIETSIGSEIYAYNVETNTIRILN